jgi:two-component system phosphate regulon sensor histidine kinase PhoR
MIKYSGNPTTLSIQLTIIILLVLIVLDLSSYFLYPHLGVWVIVINVVVAAPLFFWIFYQIIGNFIYKKIRVIYKNIHSFKVGKRSYSPERLENKDVIESVNRDVIEWMEKQKEEISQLRSNAKFRREFIGNLSHELKTPIFNIQGYVLTLLDGGLEDKKINKKYLQRTAKSIDRIIAMLKDLDTISALESGNLELKMETFNIEEFAMEMIEFFELKAQEKQIQIFIVNRYGAPISVVADKAKIRQVCTNLIDNAIKYMIDRPDPYIKISLFDMHDNILMEITDNGGGIDEKHLPRLFERFFRVDTARSREQGGTGLGLSIAKHIMDAHNQTITVRSTLGVGTTFGITLKKA